MLVLQIELSHGFEIGKRKPFAKLIREPLRQCLDDLFPISGPILTALFLLDDAPANLKVGVNLNQVHATGHVCARPGDQFADVVEE